jgi:hypothetical protein
LVLCNFGRPQVSTGRTPHPARRAPSVFCKGKCILNILQPGTPNQSSCNQNLTQSFAIMGALSILPSGEPSISFMRGAPNIMKPGAFPQKIYAILRLSQYPACSKGERLQYSATWAVGRPTQEYTCKQGCPQIPFSHRQNLSVMQPWSPKVSCTRGAFSIL